MTLDGLDWPRIAADLDRRGWALTSQLLDDGDCAALAGLYDRETGFRLSLIHI